MSLSIESRCIHLEGDDPDPRTLPFWRRFSTKSAKAETTDEIGAYVKSMKDAL